MNWFHSINPIGLLIVSGALMLGSACTHAPAVPEVAPISEREFLFEKGIGFLDASDYQRAQPFFLKISLDPENNSDHLYEKSLWNLALIFEKLGQPEKALLTLQELERSPQTGITLFKIQLAEMKNHFRVSNQFQAYQVKKAIDQSRPIIRYSFEEIDDALMETSTLNFDHLILEELQYIVEAEKYFVYVMESKKSPMNAAATERLISICERSYDLLRNETLKREFRIHIAEELLDILRKFEQYKLDDLNLNIKTISKFSVYAEKKQKLILDWLHQ